MRENLKLTNETRTYLERGFCKQKSRPGRALCAFARTSLLNFPYVSNFLGGRPFRAEICHGNAAIPIIIAEKILISILIAVKISVGTPGTPTRPKSFPPLLKQRGRAGIGPAKRFTYLASGQNMLFFEKIYT